MSCGCSTNITRPLCSGALASPRVGSSLAPPRTFRRLGGGRRQVRPGEWANVPVGFLRGPPRLRASSAAPEETLQGCSSSAGGAGTPADSHQPRPSWPPSWIQCRDFAHARHVLHFFSLFFGLILSCCAAVSAAAASRGDLRLGGSVPTAEKWFLRSRTLAVAPLLRCCAAVAPGPFRLAAAELIVDRCNPRGAEIRARLMRRVCCTRLPAPI